MEGIVREEPLAIAVGETIRMCMRHKEILIEGLKGESKCICLSDVIHPVAQLLYIKGVSFRSDGNSNPSATIYVSKNGRTSYTVEMTYKRKKQCCAPIALGADENVCIKIDRCDALVLRIKIAQIAQSMFSNIARRNFLPTSLGAYNLSDASKQCPLCDARLESKFDTVREMDDVAVRYHISICIYCPVCNRCKRCEKQMNRFERDVCERCRNGREMHGGWE